MLPTANKTQEEEEEEEEQEQEEQEEEEQERSGPGQQGTVTKSGWWSYCNTTVQMPVKTQAQLRVCLERKQESVCLGYCA
ncbi:protein bfr2-like [Myripristis murdjan]|uniref:protein bfr2-like n=1 Tax=Myripristis murdjan TaxID=586833 RepID=UPI001176475A|nr:protein bfr2-like [Myripristis murdjan]